MNKFLLTFLSLFLIGTLSAQTEMLTGGNMESETGWTVNNLSSAAGEEAVPTWNYTTDGPTGGSAGNLYVEGGGGTTADVQFAIYQELTLSSEKSYTFSGLYKHTEFRNAWCQVFIGKSEPMTGSDYSDNEIVGFTYWGAHDADGSFTPDNNFIPDETGQYFLVLKVGCATDGNFKIMLDEFSLLESREKPVVDFEADYTCFFPNMEVQFTNKSLAGVSYSWDFGDGSGLSTEENPKHTYTSAGIYNVTLTATNEVGSTVLEKENFIIVNEAQTLTGGGILQNADMSAQGAWSVTNLNTDPTNLSVEATWNDQVNVPTAGQGGALYVTGNAPSGQNAQFCIYQEVTLSSDKLYEFNAAFKDLSANLHNAWIEVFIGPMPIDGADYSKDDADKFLLAEVTTWNGDCTPKGADATLELRACNGTHSYVPETSGTYYLVLKTGSWEGGDFAIAIDELSLTELDSKPLVEFSADKQVGFAPLTVTFTDESKFASSWSWDFGDGSEVSTEQNPTHTYANPGTYTVELTATNAQGTSVGTKTDFIKVNEKPTLPEGEMIYGGNMEDPNLWNISGLNNDASFPKTVAWNYRDVVPEYGEGGNLHLAGSGEFNQYAIWQEVELTAGKEYVFYGAKKDIIAGGHWCEILLGTTKPVDGSDYSDNQFCSMGDGSGAEAVGSYSPTESGTYYFVVKMGSWYEDFDFVIDELSLMEYEKVEVDFFALATEGAAPFAATFMNASTNATSYLWDFGDGNTSTDENPSHTYTVPGTYTVTLTAMNGPAKAIKTVTDLITVTGTAPAVVADFSADVMSGNAPLTVVFTNTTTGANTYSWDFGDGNSSTEKSPTHTYESAGTFTVTLTASNATNNDEVTKTDYISTVTTGITSDGFGEVKLYPNPSTGLINVELGEISNSTVEVYNLAGKKIMSKLQQDNVVTLNISDKGIFIVKVISDKKISTHKVVIK